MERRHHPAAALRVLAAILAAAGALACGEAGDEDVARPFHEQDDPRIARLLEEDTGDPLTRDPPVVRVLVTYDATNYFVDAGQQRGLEYELMRDLESFLAERRPADASPLRVVFVALRFDDLIVSLLAGRGDVVAAGLTITEERARRVAFSEPYRAGSAGGGRAQRGFGADREGREPRGPGGPRGSLAAYNAGPARVQSLRREALEHGLDPNRWFGHVEHVARARIGRETVRYVANVNKIYVALRSVRHQLESRERARETHAGGSARRLSPRPSPRP